MSTEPIKSWTRLLESSSSGYAELVIIGSDGSIYTSGYDSNDYILKKYNSDGSKLWTRSLLGSTAYGEANAIVVSSDGSIYVAGYREDNLYGTINGDADGFLSKYSSDGSKSWTRLVGSSEWDSANTVTISSDGSIYVAGDTSGNLDGNSNAGSDSDAFLSKYSSDGSKSWTRMLGSSEWDSANTVTISSDGSIYVAGRTEGNLEGNSNNDGDSDDGFTDLGDAFLSKYNSDGSKSWTRLLGSSGREDVDAVTTSSDGSIYIAGSTSGNLDGNSNAGGDSDAFLSKYNSDGSKSWTRLLGFSGDDNATMVTTSNDGSIYVGVISEIRDDTFGAPLGSGASLSRYNSDGSKSWTRSLEIPEYDWVNSVATSSDGSIYVLGSKDKGITGDEYFSRSDLFLTKYTLKNGNGTPGVITSSTPGIFRESVTLTAPLITGDPDGDATSPNYAYQWFKGSTAITNATASTYAVPASGAGTYKVAVNYTDAQGFTATLDSPEQVVSTFNNGNGTPGSITSSTAGVFREGVTLTAPVVTGDPDGEATNPNYTYQWFKGSTAITNATASTYAVPASGAGTYKVAVNYTDAQGFTATVDSPNQYVVAGEPIKQWTRLLGSSFYDIATSISTAADGSIYITGYTSGSLDGQTHSGSFDAIVSKYSSDGTKAWTRLLGSSDIDSATSISTAADGSIYITGYTYGSLDGQTNSGGFDAFISKYSSDGTKAWTRLLGSYFNDIATSISAAADGSIYITGRTSGSLDGQTNSGGDDAFISKYRSDGTKEWTRLLGSSSDVTATSIRTAADGSIYITGSTSGSLDGQTNSGGIDAFISKYSSDGTKAWTRLLGTSSNDYANSISAAADGSIYITGSTSGSLDGQTNSGGFDAFISKYSSDGTKEWTRLLGSSSDEEAESISTAADGSVYITGSIGEFFQNYNILTDFFVGKYSSDGIKTWTRLLESSNLDVSAAADGSIYITGSTSESLDGQTNSGGDDVIIIRFAVRVGTPASITGNGAFQEGVTLTAPVVNGDPDGDALSPNYSYQWFKGSTAITNATASTYVVPVTGAGTYKVAVTYTDAQGFTATLDSPEQVVSKPTSHQVEIAPSQRGSLFRVENAAVAEVIVNLKGSPDLVEIDAEVSATLNAVTTENWSTGYVALNVGSTIQAGTGERVSLNGLGKYSFVATAINAATSTVVLEQGKNSAFFLHDAYSAFYEGLTLSTDSTGRQSAARILDFDVIKMGSAGGNSIVDLTSKDYITGAVNVHGADKGRSIFWGTDSDDTFLSGGGDSVVFGGGGFNQSILGAGKDVLQFRSTVDSTNLIQGFDPTKDVLELWRGRTETVEAPTFITEGNSATMTWGSNTVQFEGITGLSTESLMITTRIAL